MTRALLLALLATGFGPCAIVVAPARADIYVKPNTTSRDVLVTNTSAAAAKVYVSTGGVVVFGSTRPATGAIVTSSGTVVVQSTSSTSGYAPLRVLNYAGAELFKLTQAGNAVLAAGGQWQGDGSALSGVPGSNSTTTWTAPQFYSSSVNLSSATSSLVVGSSFTARGRVDLTGATVVVGSSFTAQGRVDLTGATVVGGGWAKAWAKITVSGGTPSLTAGYNVASITDNGVGDYTINFTIPFASANYATLLSGRQLGGADVIVSVHQTGGQAAGSCRVAVALDDGTASDIPEIYAVFFGDQ